MKLKRALLILFLVLGIGAGLVVAQHNPVLAQDAKGQICAGVGAAGGGGCGDTRGIDTLVKTIVNVLSWVVGILSVIMIIYAGFRYVTSGGDSGQIGSAKNTLIYAIVGLVIAAMAQAIVQFVLTKV